MMRRRRRCLVVFPAAASGLAAPVTALAHAFGEPRYWLTFWLADGTTLGRPYFVETRELMGGVALPEEFTRILERYLSE